MIVEQSAADLMHIMAGGLAAHALIVACRLELPDAFQGGPQSLECLAERTGAQPAALHLLLRALAALGVCSAQPDGRYAPTALSEQMRAVAGSKRAHILYTGEILFPVWSGLEHTLRTGGSAFAAVLGQELYAYNTSHPEAAALFDEWVAQTNAEWLLPAIDACELPATGTVVDVGGGRGVLLTAVLERNSGLRGVLFEQPAVAEAARRTLDAARLGHRAEVVVGDFFASVPMGGDVYLAGRVLFNWDEDRAARILRNCRAAMAARSRLLILEPVLPEGDGASLAALAALHVLACGGHVLTESEWRARLVRAGLRLVRVQPTPAQRCVLEAVCG
jgi:hypothetical protein